VRCEIVSKNRIDKNIDEIDIRIIDLMILDKNNKEISQDLKIPLSTIQRRVRNLISVGYVTFKAQINYQKFGFKTGLLHIYLRNGNIEETAKKIHSLQNVTTVEIHIGNSDILGHVVYRDSRDLLNLISEVKKLDNIERIVWSERIFQSTSKENKDVINILNGQEN
jgi:Lrp/AsnC family transcriptional regulator, regulator for asnA, asnC and gidA